MMELADAVEWAHRAEPAEVFIASHPRKTQDALWALVAEVERLVVDNAALTAENARIFAMVDAREQTIAELTALCDEYRGEVAALKAVEARVAHIKRSYAGGENWLRCLERAEKAESAPTLARSEGMEDLACYMIDNCEGDIITEEYLQNTLSDCIKDAATRAARGVNSEG